MSPSARAIRTLACTLAVFTAVTLGDVTAFAHARYDRSEPPAGAMVPGTPLVLKVWFTQELMRASTIVIVDESGARVDLGDGRVDLDDPDRKVMLITVPELPTGSYTVYWSTVSAEDGHTGCGAFTLGAGVAPPPVEQVAPEPGLAPGEVRSWEFGELQCAISD
jgi:methionine-rich copper-binding protein CopC